MQRCSSATTDRGSTNHRPSFAAAASRRVEEGTKPYFFGGWSDGLELGQRFTDCADSRRRLLQFAAAGCVQRRIRLVSEER